MEPSSNGLGNRSMSDDMRNTVGQGGAWLAAIIGTFSFEIWLALAGFTVSAFIAYINYRSRKLEDRSIALRDRLEEEKAQLLRDEAQRSKELHELELERLRRGLNIPSATTHPAPHNPMAEPAKVPS